MLGTTRFCLGSLAALVTMLPVSTSAADIDTEKLSKVKAAFLLNFIKFTTWPKEKHASGDVVLRVTVVGKDDLDGVLDATLRGREWNGHPIQLSRVPPLPLEGAERQTALGELTKMHLVYVAPSSMLKKGDLETLNRHAVLTVAFDMSQTRQGTVLGFHVEQGKVGFLYNTQAAKESPLQISSKLLNLSRALN
jgi:hypothetical protein